MPADAINTMTATTAWAEARLCSDCAERALNDLDRRQFLDMRDSWIRPQTKCN
jgi:hypothetical protein